MILRGDISWYNEKSAPNKTVAMLGSVVCKKCNGTGKIPDPILPNNKEGLKKSIEINFTMDCLCKDGLLTSQIPFSSQLLECAIAPSFSDEMFGGWSQAKGQIVRLKYSYDERIPNYIKTVVVRITDIMKDHLCRCGHTKQDHVCNCHYAPGGCSNPTNFSCSEIGCDCIKYSQRVIDLTEFAFSLLAPTSQGILKDVTIERIS